MNTPADLPRELLIDAPLAEELERHGLHLHAGDRVRLQLVTGGERDGDELWDAFIGSFESEEPDLAQRGDRRSAAGSGT